MYIECVVILCVIHEITIVTFGCNVCFIACSAFQVLHLHLSLAQALVV